jgi:hypothetical protein
VLHNLKSCFFFESKNHEKAGQNRFGTLFFSDIVYIPTRNPASKFAMNFKIWFLVSSVVYSLASKDSQKRALDILGNMTLDEKIDMLHGIPGDYVG